MTGGEYLTVSVVNIALSISLQIDNSCRLHKDTVRCQDTVRSSTSYLWSPLKTRTCITRSNRAAQKQRDCTRTIRRRSDPRCSSLYSVYTPASLMLTPFTRPHHLCLQRLHAPITYAYSVYTPFYLCLLYTSPSPRDRTRSRMPSSA